MGLGWGGLAIFPATYTPQDCLQNSDNTETPHPLAWYVTITSLQEPDTCEGQARRRENPPIGGSRSKNKKYGSINYSRSGYVRHQKVIRV